MSVTAECATTYSTSSGNLRNNAAMEPRNKLVLAGYRTPSSTTPAKSPRTKPPSKWSLASREEFQLSPEAGVLLRKFPCLSDVSDLLKSGKSEEF